MKSTCQDILDDQKRQRLPDLQLVMPGGSFIHLAGRSVILQGSGLDSGESLFEVVLESRLNRSCSCHDHWRHDKNPSDTLPVLPTTTGTSLLLLISIWYSGKNVTSPTTCSTM